jgi:hypothetical protein
MLYPRNTLNVLGISMKQVEEVAYENLDRLLHPKLFVASDWGASACLFTLH